MVFFFEYWSAVLKIALFRVALMFGYCFKISLKLRVFVAIYFFFEIVRNVASNKKNTNENEIKEAHPRKSRKKIHVP